MTIMEEQLLNQVTHQLQWDNRLSAADIKVSVNGATVTLEGTVPTSVALRAAESDSYLVRGVNKVNNLLKIEYQQEDMPGDMEIESNIRNILIWDNNIDSTNVEISVASGVVNLDGTVNTPWERELIEEKVLSSRGVYQVNNNLNVNVSGSMNDEIIAEEVKLAIDRNPYVNAEDIIVIVNEGMVTLTGNVQSYLAANAAHDSAMFTTGVRGVIDNVTIG
ncbi:MAG: BON domain-containing protein [Bacteroidales bacterium]